MLLSMMQRNYDALQRHAQLASDQPALPSPSLLSVDGASYSQTIIREWSLFYSPAEIMSVNAAYSVFSPGQNWPGNVRFAI
jgi:hypothetical protein